RVVDRARHRVAADRARDLTVYRLAAAVLPPLPGAVGSRGEREGHDQEQGEESHAASLDRSHAVTTNCTLVRFQAVTSFLGSPVTASGSTSSSSKCVQPWRLRCRSFAGTRS